MHRTILFWLIIAGCFAAGSLEAQLTAPGSQAMRFTQYSGSTARKDPVFIFCAADGSDRGSLRVLPEHSATTFDFTWYRYHPGSSSFQLFAGPLTAADSRADTLSPGGYRIEVSTAGWDTAYHAWVHMDLPVAEARVRDFKCSYVALGGTAAVDTFIYYDPTDGTPRRLPNDCRFLWTADPATSIPYPDLEINPVSYSPPVEDTYFTIEVADSFGCSAASEVFYESIHVEAGFEGDPTQGEAPLEVAFTNTSVNAARYEWDFGDDSVSLLADPPPHRYYVPGEYSVRLAAYSEEECVDSLRFNYIVVEPSQLEIPNVFTPGPELDGVNDFFVVSSKSLRYLSVQIFSVTGTKVYSFTGEGEALSAWQGWDGTISGGNYASTGVYYYVIRAIGWDDIDYSGKEYRGFLHLYRHK